MIDRFVEFWIDHCFQRMSSRGSSRRSSRGNERGTRRRRTGLEVDLNDTPAGDVQAAEVIGEAPQNGQQGGVGGSAAAASLPTIDVEDIDDDVVISSPRSFAEARNKARRNNDVTVIEDDLQTRAGDSEEVVTRLSLSSNSTRKRRPPNQAIINSDSYINLEGSNSSKRRKVAKSVEPPPPPPPKEPVFTCPVCIGPLTEETSTKCGHIFCKKCIKTAIAAQSKCPTCRRKLAAKDTFRVYLPSTN